MLKLVLEALRMLTQTQILQGFWVKPAELCDELRCACNPNRFNLAIFYGSRVRPRWKTQSEGKSKLASGRTR
jgi:hypothetical protein